MQLVDDSEIDSYDDELPGSEVRPLLGGATRVDPPDEAPVAPWWMPNHEKGPVRRKRRADAQQPDGRDSASVTLPVLDAGTLAVICIVAFVQGAASLCDLAMQYMMKDDLKFSPAQLALATGVIASPWIAKPIFGFISDSIPIFGMRRRSYLFIFGLTGFASYWALHAWARTTVPVVASLFGASFSICFVNVLAEALIVERGGGVGEGTTVDPARKAATRKRVSWLMTLYWGVTSLTMIGAGYFSGHLVEVMKDKRDIFTITAFFPLLLCLLSFGINERSSEGQPVLSFAEQRSRLMEALSDKQIWGPLVFVFVWMSMPSSQASFFFFLTNELGIPPEFMGQLKVVEGTSSLLGLLFYHKVLNGRVSHRKILKVSIVAAFVAGATPLVLVLHLNRQWGIPDRYFCLGSTALLSGVWQVALMPLLVLGAERCKPNIEATLYSCLMSACNIGGLLSTDLGALLTFLLGVSEHNFSRLWLLVLICDACTLLPLPLLLLVPADAEADSTAQPATSIATDAGSTSPALLDSGTSSLPAPAAAVSPDAPNPALRAAAAS